MKQVWELTSENLTHLGGRMGTEYTTDNFTMLFSKKSKAKKFAEEDYGKPLKWFKGKNERQVKSKDLGYVQYFLNKKDIN